MADSQHKELPIGPEPSISSEQVPGPEQFPEAVSTHEKASAAPSSPQPVVLAEPSAMTPAYAGDAIVLEKVEKILAENMDNVFLTMDAATQQRFKLKGEETARKITTLFSRAKVKVKDIINLIIDWLKIIPRVNRYYLEQEAKLKADAILRIYKK